MMEQQPSSSARTEHQGDDDHAAAAVAASFIGDESGGEFHQHPRSSESRQSSLNADSEEIRVLGEPLSDRSELEEEEGGAGQRPKTLVDQEGRNVLETMEEERKEEDSLRDFEEQEREVAKQLAMEEDPAADGELRELEGGEGEETLQLMEQIPEEEEENDDNDEEEEEAEELEVGLGLWRTEAEEPPRSSQSRVSESLQNRQFSGAEVLREESELKQRLGSDRSDGDRSSLGGYPLDYPTDPPPAYTSPRAISRGRLFVGERPSTSSTTLGHQLVASAGGISLPKGGTEKEATEGEEEEEVHRYAVPSPRFERLDEAAADDSAEEEEEEQSRSAEPNADIRKAFGSSFALAGGMAAAVAAAAAGAGNAPPPPPMSSPGRSHFGQAATPRQSPRLLVQGARTAADLSAIKPAAAMAAEQARGSSARGGSVRGARPPTAASQQQQQPTENAAAAQQRFPISGDLKALFRHIEEFVADRVELEPQLKPFQVDYIPAVGDVDPFIKVPRPDENDDLQLGLAVLDEPAATQSDPAIVDLRLHQMAGKSGGSSDLPVKKLSRADRNAHQIDRWIQSVRDLRRTKPPDRVNYSKPMPSIEALMQEWPQGVEQSLKGMKLLLNANLDVALEDYADLCLALVDIPVHKSRLEALHLFFSLYAEFRNSQHFRNLALGQTDAERGETAPTIDNFVLDEAAESGGGADRLEIGT